MSIPFIWVTMATVEHHPARLWYRIRGWYGWDGGGREDPSLSEVKPIKHTSIGTIIKPHTPATITGTSKVAYPHLSPAAYQAVTYLE